MIIGRGSDVTTRKRILIIDDSATARLMTCMILQGEPYDLITALDGADGLAKAKKLRPDLILLDVIMPRMDGIEACKRLRDDPDTTRTPIIMVTSRDEVGIAEASYAYGCDEFVNKPIDPVELLTKVRRQLKERDA